MNFVSSAVLGGALSEFRRVSPELASHLVLHPLKAEMCNGGNPACIQQIATDTGRLVAETNLFLWPFWIKIVLGSMR